jgi:hypothetical protein
MFSTQNTATVECYMVDANHAIVFWRNYDGMGGAGGHAQIFTINTSTWAVTTAAASFQFDTLVGSTSSCFQIDSAHFINFWMGPDSDGFVQVFAVDTSTWAVTTAAAALEFDTQSGSYSSCFQVDSNHFINFWMGPDNDGFVQVFAVDTSTWAVTTANANLEFDTTLGQYNSCFQVDGNHFINFWAGSGSDGYVQIFAVNTSTWAVTTAAANLEFDTVSGQYNSCFQVDSTHFIDFWAGSGSDGYVQIFAVNTSTWAVTTAAASLEFDTAMGLYNSCAGIDSNHFIDLWRATVGGYIQVFAVDTSTWAVTTAAASLQFDTKTIAYTACVKVDASHIVVFWCSSGASWVDAYAQVFAVTVPSTGIAIPVLTRQYRQRVT